MTRSGRFERGVHPLRRVTIFADESARWKVAGLRQLDRLLLSLAEFARNSQPDIPITVHIVWDEPVPAERRDRPVLASLPGLELVQSTGAPELSPGEVSLSLDTRLVPSRVRFPEILEALSVEAADSSLVSRLRTVADGWDYLTTRADIPRCERRFLQANGKSQDGLASRFLNRPLSRLVTRGLLKTPVTPSAWSTLIFVLPLCAAFAFLRGTYISFIVGCGIFQLYSILDGCDGEIARAKYLQSEFGRRQDSFLDLVGNLLLALTLGLGLARHAEMAGSANGWIYFAEGIAAVGFIVLSEGIVFVRRARSDGMQPESITRWNGALYQRHHEFLERSGILVLGEKFAWWLVQLTKRDMAMLAFLFLAIVGLPQWNLHLLITVSAISSLLACNAFLRQPAPVLSEEAS